MEAKQNTLYVGALAKGLKVLKVFDESNTSLSLSDLASLSGLDKSATQRLANTLHLEGMLDKDPQTKRYSPSHAWLEMAYHYSMSDPLIGNALPRLIDLSQEIGETVNLLEKSDDHIIYVYRLPCKRSKFASSIVGRRIPALCTTGGRVMLSSLPPAQRKQAINNWPIKQFTAQTTTDRKQISQHVEQASEEGFSIAVNELIMNELAVSAPIISSDGIARSAVQCAVSSQVWTEQRLREEIVPHLLDVANAIAPTL